MAIDDLIAPLAGTGGHHEAFVAGRTGVRVPLLGFRCPLRRGVGLQGLQWQTEPRSQELQEHVPVRVHASQAGPSPDWFRGQVSQRPSLGLQEQVSASSQSWQQHTPG